MPELSEEIRRLLSGTAPGQTIFTKEQSQAAAPDAPTNPFQWVIDLLKGTEASAAASDNAATALQEQLARAGLDIDRGKLGLQREQLGLAKEAQAFGFDISRGQLDVSRGQLDVARGSLAEGGRQFDITQTFLEGQEAFKQQDINAQRLLEAAGLATGPTGAIQLAYLSRGLGAPQEEVASIFQNLPFVQELLHGQNAAGFGLPEQLGGEMRRVSGEGGTIEGKNLGVTIPGKKSINRQAFGTLSAFEQEFLGALGQSETGQSVEGFLQDITKSFIPTQATKALSIG